MIPACLWLIASSDFQYLDCDISCKSSMNHGVHNKQDNRQADVRLVRFAGGIKSPHPCALWICVSPVHRIVGPSTGE
eukprot:scaffold220864_cov17-Tisochrysis_lutea.AAC.1